MAVPPTNAAGKLETLGAKSRACEKKKKKFQQAHALTIAVSTPTGGYQLEATVDGVSVPFLLDTGAAVSLLREDTWKRVNAGSRTLEPWNKKRLVSVDGTPLRTLGRAKVDLNLAGRTYRQEVLVVSALTAPAILGLDFLQENAVSVDLKRKQLMLTGHSTPLALIDPGESGSPDNTTKVSLTQTQQIPPWSEWR